MEEGLYRKIVDEMSAVRFGGVLKLYCGNEPLLDPRLPRLVKYARERLPDLARLQVNTNGILLTEGLGKELIESGVSLLNINDYTNDGGGGRTVNNESIEGIYEKLVKVFPGQSLKYYPRRTDEVLNSFGGHSPNNRMRLVRPIKAPCAYPFFAFVVTSNGSVGLCCSDMVFEEPLGNVKDSSVASIWRGKPFADFREDLLRGKRTKKLCSNCTIFGHFDLLGQTGETFYLYRLLSMPLRIRSRAMTFLRSIKE
jgi:8-amino-3,8-dideoxy-alpha-D-manno-octulosonate transaminase